MGGARDRLRGGLCSSFPSRKSGWGRRGFQARGEQFSARSRKSRACAEAYCSTPHKRARRLTPRSRKRASAGRELARRLMQAVTVYAQGVAACITQAPAAPLLIQEVTVCAPRVDHRFGVMCVPLTFVDGTMLDRRLSRRAEQAAERSLGVVRRRQNGPVPSSSLQTRAQLSS